VGRWKLVSERFELPPTFCGVLRYEDPDGDLISVSTDDEVAEALRLCGEGQTLKMTLVAAAEPAPAVPAAKEDVPAVGKAWAGALSNDVEVSAAAAVAEDVAGSPASRASVSSASGDFELVDGSDSRPTSTRSSTAASSQEADAAPEDEEEKALQAALKASAEEAAAKAAEEARAAEETARIAEEARLAEEKRLAEEARAAEEAARAVEEAARAAEEEARLAEEKRLAEEARAAEEAARIAEARAAEEAARIAEEARALEARKQLQADEDEERRARLEIAFAAAEEDALRRADELLSMGCSVDQIRSLYGESILMHLRLVPRLSDVQMDEPAVPEPVVNWEAAQAVVQQPEEERFPSQEQAAVVDRVGDLAARLTAFYFEHNSDMIETVSDLSRKFVDNEQELNDALMRKYKCDLTTLVAQQAAAAAEQEERDAAAARKMIEDGGEFAEEFAEAHNEAAAELKANDGDALNEVVREALTVLESMGFTERERNLALLSKHANNVEAALNELLG
jgi:chemotaxis protein histidine kinase CheA